MKPDAWINQLADEFHLAFRCDLVADDSEPLYRASTVKQEVERLRERYGELEAAARNVIAEFPLDTYQAIRELTAALRDLQEGRDA